MINILTAADEWSETPVKEGMPFHHKHYTTKIYTPWCARQIDIAIADRLERDGAWVHISEFDEKTGEPTEAHLFMQRLLFAGTTFESVREIVWQYFYDEWKKQHTEEDSSYNGICEVCFPEEFNNKKPVWGEI